MKSLKHTVRQMVRRTGLDVVRYSPDRFPELQRLEWIRQAEINYVVDVGANAGQWSGRLRDSGYDGDLVSFEPLSKAFAELSRRTVTDRAWTARQEAIGEFDGEATIHVAANSWSSSLLEMEDRHLASAPESAYVTTERVAVQTLDTALADIPRPRRMLLKIDAQGYEMQVLRGADMVLRDAAMLELELSLVPLYTGQALLPEIVAYLSDRTFDLVVSRPGFTDRATGEILQVDGIFLRRNIRWSGP
jgi:FkbM family methyltransferase